MSNLKNPGSLRSQSPLNLSMLKETNLEGSLPRGQPENFIGTKLYKNSD